MYLLCGSGAFTNTPITPAFLYNVTCGISWKTSTPREFIQNPAANTECKQYESMHYAICSHKALKGLYCYFIQRGGGTTKITKAG